MAFLFGSSKKPKEEEKKPTEEELIRKRIQLSNCLTNLEIRLNSKQIETLINLMKVFISGGKLTPEEYDNIQKILTMYTDASYILRICQSETFPGIPVAAATVPKETKQQSKVPAAAAAVPKETKQKTAAAAAVPKETKQTPKKMHAAAAFTDEDNPLTGTIVDEEIMMRRAVEESKRQFEKEKRMQAKREKEAAAEREKEAAVKRNAKLLESCCPYGPNCMKKTTCGKDYHYGIKVLIMCRNGEECSNKSINPDKDTRQNKKETCYFCHNEEEMKFERAIRLSQFN